MFFLCRGLWDLSRNDGVAITIHHLSLHYIFGEWILISASICVIYQQLWSRFFFHFHFFNNNTKNQTKTYKIRKPHKKHTSNSTQVSISKFPCGRSMGGVRREKRVVKIELNKRNEISYALIPIHLNLFLRRTLNFLGLIANPQSFSMLGRLFGPTGMIWHHSSHVLIFVIYHYRGCTDPVEKNWNIQVCLEKTLNVRVPIFTDRVHLCLSLFEIFSIFVRKGRKWWQNWVHFLLLICVFFIEFVNSNGKVKNRFYVNFDHFWNWK